MPCYSRRREPRVVVNDPGGSLKGEGVDAGPAEEAAREIRAAGGEAVACTASVATPEGGNEIIEAALDHYGRIDILIHNAGIVRAASLKEMTHEDFDAVLDVHLRGAFHVVRPAFPAHVQSRLRPYRADLVDRRFVWQSPRGELRRRQGGPDRIVQRRRARGRCGGREVQRHRSRRRDENGRGFGHVGLSSHVARDGGARGGLACP